MSKTFRTLTIIGLLSTLFLFIISLIARRMHVDDVILSEPTYWLAHEGILRSEGQRGWQSAELKFLFTHKLYVYGGALFIKIFGWSSAAVKSLSLVYFIGLLGVAWKILKYFKIESFWFLFFVFITLLHNQIFELAFVYRPEIAVACCLLGCYFLLQLYLDQRRFYYLVFAGVVAALGIGNHLNGVIIPGAGCLLLIYYRCYKEMFFFGVMASFGFLFQLLGVHDMADFELMRSQFSHMQDIQNEHFNIFHYLLNIPAEQQRYLHSPREIAGTLFFVSSILVARKYLWQQYRALVIFVFSAALVLAVIAHGKDSKYLALLLPAFLLLTTLGFSQGLLQFKKAILVLLSLYIATETYFNTALAFSKEHRTEAYQNLVGDLPLGSKVLTPVYATYWATPRYRMQWFFAYKVRASHQDFEVNIQALNSELDRFEIAYVIFDKEEYDIYQPSPENMPKFELKNVDASNQLWFFQRKR